MKATRVAAAIGCGMLFCASLALAGEKGTADQAISMVKKAVALVKSEGREKAFAAIADPANETFHQHDLYIYVYDLNGFSLSHGNNPKMIGKQLIGLKDNDGKAMIREMITLAKTKGKGWVDYKWPNPMTKEVEAKSGYVERIDDMFIGSGIYK